MMNWLRNKLRKLLSISSLGASAVPAASSAALQSGESTRQKFVEDIIFFIIVVMFIGFATMFVAVGLMFITAFNEDYVSQEQLRDKIVESNAKIDLLYQTATKQNVEVSFPQLDRHN
jgi:hypothetical protein